jgi:uncharacterized protein with beta-barrel porin domain
MRQSYKRYLRSVGCIGAGVAGTLLYMPAYGGDLTVSSTVTTPVSTSLADGVGPGNVTVTSAGTISVTSGAAVTLDSNNSVTNSGAIQNAGESNATGILISTSDALGAARNIVGAVTHNGSLSIPGPASASPLFPTFVNNAGIAVRGAGLYQGSITLATGSTINVGGNGATGIGAFAGINGSITNNGTITIGRQGSFGIAATAGLTGQLINAGTIDMQGQESVGIYAGGGVGGAIINQGTVISGKATTTGTTPTAAVRGSPSMWIAGNAGGILLEGNGLTTAQEADGIPAGSAADSSLTTFGGAEALSITQGGASGSGNITIGALAGDASGASLRVRGIIASEVTRGTLVRAVNISGATVGGTNYQTTFAGAFINQGGNISAIGIDTEAQAVRIGSFATVPTLENAGEILARGSDSFEDSTTGAAGTGGGSATAIRIEATGSLASIVNTGSIFGTSRGGGLHNAFGILDLSGTLRTIVNSGTLSATVNGSGAATAFDLSNSTGAVQITNTGNIAGNMRLGNSGSTFTSTGGNLAGDIVGGTGNDSIAISNSPYFGTILLGDGANSVVLTNTDFIGGVLLGNGTANLVISGGKLDVASTTGLNATNTTIGGGAAITFNVNTVTETGSTIKSQSVVIDSGTTLRALVAGSVIDEFTVNLIEAQSLTVNADLASQQPASTIMYNRAIKLADDNPNILQYRITRQTAEEIGLTGNLATIYENSIIALGQDIDAGPFLANMTDRAAFDSAFSQMIPDLSSATRVAALESQRQSQVAVRRRMAGFLNDDLEPLEDYDPNFWVQQFDTFGKDKGQGAIPGFRLSSYGIAVGADAGLSDRSQIGMSISHSRNSVETKNRADTPTRLNTINIDFYGRQNWDFAYVQGILGIGRDKYKSRRVVAIDTITREAASKWSGNHWGGSLEGGTHFVTGSTVLTGYVRGSYFDVYEHTHAETGGGNAVNLRYRSRSNTSVRAAAGAMAEHGIELGTFAVLKLAARGEYGREFDNSPTRVTAQFAAGGDLFTLTGATPSRTIVNAGGSTTLQLRNHAVSLDYGLERQGSYTGHNIALTYRLRF